MNLAVKLKSKVSFHTDYNCYTNKPYIAFINQHPKLLTTLSHNCTMTLFFCLYTQSQTKQSGWCLLCSMKNPVVSIYKDT